MENKEFEVLYQKYVREVFRFLLKLSGNYHVSEELTQETFVKAYISLAGFRGDCQLKVWLCQIAKNLFFDYLKRSKNVVPLEFIEENYTNMEKNSLIDDLIEKEELLKIVHMIQHLKEPYQTIIIQRLFLELDYSEIGEQFGKTENWVRVNFYRAKNKLHDMISEMEDVGNEM
ncbi:MAG: RNA polymerase sigma factor [Hungatella sp.]|jgi:RNA polymerase sigma-70 factor (ECF subfamily)|nr:RNA polymerase sigma factor [Hungatella sp.]MDR2025268.1 RNA polymerase sigma factor [Hungatella sp.]